MQYRVLLTEYKPLLMAIYSQEAVLVVRIINFIFCLLDCDGVAVMEQKELCCTARLSTKV